MANAAKILVHLMKNRTKILVRISVSISNLCFLFLISLLFVSLVFAFGFFILCFLFQISIIDNSLLFV